MDALQAQALIRFGLGRRGNEPLPADPAAWLKGQITRPDPSEFPGALSTTECLTAWRLDSQQPLPPGQPSRVNSILAQEKIQQCNNALMSSAPFRERLVWFWTNHFAVSLNRLECLPVTGAFIREAIRPHVTGKFSDMVLAVMQHPAMLMYLDNWGSIGPNSPVGLQSGKGLNENLARECLELHVLSPASGYTQADVTSMARILTGWTVNFGDQHPGFVFSPALHEPGHKTVMGKVFPEGEEGGVEALTYFADQPACHQFLATKLVRHFVADDPPAGAVATIAGVLRDTHGDLAAASVALVDLPDCWTRLTKLRTPQEYVIACARAVEAEPVTTTLAAELMDGLGQPLWTPPLPNGWADRAESWAGPEALLRRAELANKIAGRHPDPDPAEVADACLGPFLRAETLQAIKFAGSRRGAMTMLMASPEFMRR
ncbi:DUF1800 family protein [Acidisphaera sp. L21]|uniref:DUF1800 domain-containing protein n=1 Tax=Acidisphaera sp. L21 TaxID=1641851 RepID=UPI00131BD1D9|nr:DUF1800 domain-containing protein [Acidisphaera sp. L21]